MESLLFIVIPGNITPPDNSEILLIEYVTGSILKLEIAIEMLCPPLNRHELELLGGFIRLVLAFPPSDVRHGCHEGKSCIGLHCPLSNPFLYGQRCIYHVPFAHM